MVHFIAYWSIHVACVQAPPGSAPAALARLPTPQDIIELLDRDARGLLSRRSATSRSAFNSVDARRRIFDLWCEQRFDEALHECDRLVQWQRDHPSETAAWEAFDGTTMLRKAQLLIQLPPDGQRALAENIALGREIDAHSDAGRYALCVPLVERQLAAVRKWTPTDAPELARRLNALGLMLINSGKADEALPALSECMTVAQRVFPAGHPDLAFIHHVAGMYWHNAGNAGLATTMLCRASAALLLDYGVRDVRTLRSIQALVTSLVTENRLKDARAIVNAALEASHDVADLDDLLWAMLINNRAMIDQMEGDSAATERSLRFALRILRNGNRMHNPLTVVVLANLATAARMKGDLEEARRFIREAQDLAGEVLPADHQTTSDVLFEAGAIAMQQGRDMDAMTTFDTLLKMLTRLHGNDHPKVATTYNAVGLMAWQNDNLEPAEYFTNRALSVYQKSYGPDHLLTLQSLNNLGLILSSRGEFDQAESTFANVLQLARGRLAASHPTMLAAQTNLAYVQRIRGNLHGAETHLREALNLAERQRTSAIGDERGRAALAGTLILPEMTAVLADVLSRQGRHDEAVTIIERGRARALLDLLARNDRDLASEVLANSHPAAQRRLRTALSEEQAARQRLRTAEQLFGRESAAPLAGHKAKQSAYAVALATMRQAQNDYADAQAAVLTLLRDVWPDAKPADCDEIRSVLHSGDLLLLYSWTSERVLLWAIPPSQGGPIQNYVIAGDDKSRLALKRQIRAWAQRIAVRPQLRAPQSASAPADDLAAALLPAELQGLLFRASRLFIVPDGPIRDLAFDALPCNGELQAALRDRLAITYAESGTVLRRLSTNVPPHRQTPITALILADPVFDSATIAAEGRAEVAQPRNTAASKKLSADGASSQPVVKPPEGDTDLARFHSGPFVRLPASAAEAAEIERVVRSAGGTVRTLKGQDATEARLTVAAVGATMLHLGTHAIRGTEGRPYDAGLALARSDLSDSTDDGFLSLDDLMVAWQGRLRGCELVILSACGTQRGIARGDSVMALPWGFFHAGAQSVMASLWNVDDMAASLLMSEFYHQYLIRRLSPTDALREAKRTVREMSAAEYDRRVAHLPDTGAHRGLGGKTRAPKGSLVRQEFPLADPYYWSPFVLLGGREPTAAMPHAASAPAR